jgi:hypothetical protein
MNIYMKSIIRTLSGTLGNDLFVSKILFFVARFLYLDRYLVTYKSNCKINFCFYYIIIKFNLFINFSTFSTLIFEIFP